MDNIYFLDTEELALVQNKATAENQMAFAIMLKFLQHEGRYPTQADELSKTMIDSLSAQLNCNDVHVANFNWKSRIVKRFRQEIRTLLDYNEPTAHDSEQLIQWLTEEILPLAPTLAQCREYSGQFFRKHRLEPFSQKQLNRYIRAAFHRFEKQFFSAVVTQLSSDSVKAFDNLVNDDVVEFDEEKIQEDCDDIGIKLRHLKKDVAGVKLKHVEFEIDKLNHIRSINLPTQIFSSASRKVIQKYYTRIIAAAPANILEYVPDVRYASMASFCYIRSQIMTDNLAELFMQLIHKMRASAETHVKKEIVSEVKRVNGKFDILYLLAETAKEHPEGVIQDKIYPKVSKEKLQDIVEDLQHRGKWYETQVNTKVRSLYSHAHRKILLQLLDAFTFHASYPEGKALLEAITIIKNHQDSKSPYYPEKLSVPTTDVIPAEWQSMVMEPIASDDATESKVGRFKINRFNYEVAVLEELRTQLNCKSIWIAGAYRYRDPDEDLPGDWNTRREHYFQLLGLPIKGGDFVAKLKELLHKSLKELNDSIQSNDKVNLLEKNGGHIRITPSEAQAEPTNINALQQEINRRWSTISLIDILKETDLRVGFTKQFHTVASREVLDKDELRKRLLLCLYAIGSNTGLKRISAANEDANYSDLRYVKRRYLNEANVKVAITDVVNEILAIRDPKIWGEATTGCACDSTQVASWDQNLMSQWHPRYKERGVMIYWHVDRNSTCIYSQLKTCLSSEVGAMIAGVLKHDTTMNMDKTYVDTHGQSTVGFAFSHCLNFDLLPRLKGIHRQKLYYPTAKNKDSYPNLKSILKSPTNWSHIEKSYDETIKHVAALKTGIVEPDVLIKKFTKDNYSHPVYRALIEIGNAVKTIFVCRYLASEALRIEIHEALNVVERVNGIMGFIFYGKLGEISTNKRDEQSLAVASLHLLQVCMVYINTLIIQEVLSDKKWFDKLMPEDKRALSPLIHAHINPYGLFPLDLYQRLIIEMNNQEEI